MNEMDMNRRDFLKSAGLFAGLFGLGGGLAFGQSAVKKSQPRVSVQMYSVRDYCKANGLDAGLREIAKMGFAGVEFAGYYKYWGKGKELRKVLDDLGLVASGTHIGTGSFIGDNLKRTIDFHQALGCKYLIVPSDKRFMTPDGNKMLIELFNKTAEVLAPLGMKCGFHNHTAEFRKHEGKTYFDMFAEGTSSSVVLQQDCGWALVAGQDPAGLIRKYPGRYGTVHFKPAVLRGEAGRGKKAFFGQDSVNWGEVYKACCEAGGTEWITLEQEQYPDKKSSMECTRISMEGIQAMLRAAK